MKVLFLYTELSLYIEKCFEKLVENNYKLLVFRYPVNKEAPFKFNEDSRINYITYTPQSPGLLMNAIEHFSPELVFCSGWKNLFYLKVAKKYKEIKVPVVLCFDNNWNGSCRQFLATALLKRFFAKRFTFAWVPGSNQREFAIRLGFNEECIQTGFYTADIVFFQKIYFKRSKLTQQNFPKRFIYIGRYVSLKGIEDLWIAFKLFSEKFPDWELWCFGTGNLSPVAHPKIKHFGFKQPAELYSLLLDGGVFVLPSRFEPWGVIVHEMAAAGFAPAGEFGFLPAVQEERDVGVLFRLGDAQLLHAGIADDLAQRVVRQIGRAHV